MPDNKPPVPKFDPDKLNKSVIAIPLLEDIAQKPDGVFDVIIDINLEYHQGRAAARTDLQLLINRVIESQGKGGRSFIDKAKTDQNEQYIFGRLEAQVIIMLVNTDKEASQQNRRLIYKIWPDFKVSALIVKSIKTVKADAARISFSAIGEGITWAVMDSGVDRMHPHFIKRDDDGKVLFETLDTGHDRDFTVTNGQPGNPFDDRAGHGTLVAGVIAGEHPKGALAAVKILNENQHGEFTLEPVEGISGIAARCKLVSLKVLDEEGNGSASSIINAIGHIQEVNGHGRNIIIHGVNISLGHQFEPEWFACGQSPLCVEVNRLVKSGVVVVVAAGNSGYGNVALKTGESIPAGISLSINDPGNAELAITVGATHRDMPHLYGVSYFSSKGPTGDGRLKPDLVAPGEKIISCACNGMKKKMAPQAGNLQYDYCESSGTSIAAPHVSGVIAAFLSVRREFIGRPEEVKKIFLETATDLKRDRYFQGAGIVDLMRAIQSV